MASSNIVYENLFSSQNKWRIIHESILFMAHLENIKKEERWNIDTSELVDGKKEIMRLPQKRNRYL